MSAAQALKAARAAGIRLGIDGKDLTLEADAAPPPTYHVFRHGEASFHEAIFRLALIRMAVEQAWSGYLRRTDAFAALDPTEKGMVSYFLGMTLCKFSLRAFCSRLGFCILTFFAQSSI
jgi:hypothetical protein